jgi:quercetin dioxygenase-like cupin family protein
MKITDLQETPKIKTTMEGAAGAYKQVPIARDDGAPTFSFRVFTLDPHGHTPLHSHHQEHVNYVISGQGVLISDDGTEHPVSAGNFALILPGETHQFRNTSATEPLVFICAVPKDYE